MAADLDTSLIEPGGPGGRSVDDQAAPGRVLVFGASGYVGSKLVPRLLRDGYAVRASGRNLQLLQARGWDRTERVEADALRPDTLPAALQGVDRAFYLVHSMAAGRDFGRLDLEAAENFAAAAERAGVRRIVYLGGLIPHDADSEHLVSRRETGVRLRAGRVPVTEIRAGIIIGPGSAAYEVIRDRVNHLPLMLTPLWVQSKSSPIALDDLLEYLVRVAWLPQAAGRVLDAGGPEYLSYEQLMRQYGAQVGRRPRIWRVPVLTPTLSSYWLGLVTAVPAKVAGALIGGLKHDLPADDAELRALDRGPADVSRLPARQRVLRQTRQRPRGRQGLKRRGVADGEHDRRRPRLLLDRAGPGARAPADAALRHARAGLGRARVRDRPAG